MKSCQIMASAACATLQNTQLNASVTVLDTADTALAPIFWIVLNALGAARRHVCTYC